MTRGLCERKVGGLPVFCFLCTQPVCKNCRNFLNVCNECIERDNKLVDRLKREQEQELEREEES